mmetsp:Transcript_6442/g.6992  ORF Transcript_6442/g.6992 Transcript_6442/m.6992 type:complete len:272 (-) Transcript_6442:47-862(-)
MSYHMRLMPVGTRIALSAGRNKHAILAYLKEHNGFGHDIDKIVWIPSVYKKPRCASTSPDLPEYPSGAASWLFEEKTITNRLIAEGVEYIILTDGTKVGHTLEKVQSLLDTVTNDPAECGLAVYNDLDLSTEVSCNRFDVLANKRRGVPKGYYRQTKINTSDFLCLSGISGWYVLKSKSIKKLWGLEKEIMEIVHKHPLRRKWKDPITSDIVDIEILEVTMPLMLVFLSLKMIYVSRGARLLGTGLKNINDITKCNSIFQKRVEEGKLRRQ